MSEYACEWTPERPYGLRYRMTTTWFASPADRRATIQILRAGSDARVEVNDGAAWLDYNSPAVWGSQHPDYH